MIKKRGGMRRAADHARQHGRVDRAISSSGLVAKRLRQALADPAGRLSVPVRPGADPGDDRRGAGPVHLRDLLTDGSSSGTLLAPVRPDGGAATLDGRTGRAASCGARFEAPDGIPNLRLPASRAPTSCAASTRTRRFPVIRRTTACRAARAGRAKRVRAPARSARSPATRGSSRSAAGPGRCACILPAPIAWSSAPT